MVNTPEQESHFVGSNILLYRLSCLRWWVVFGS